MRRSATPDARSILRERARALAQRPPAPAGSMLDVLEFRLARERYGVETRHVREVCPLRHLTPLPCSPRFVHGLVNIRGRVVPVLDIRRFFDLPEQGLNDLHRVIVVQGLDLELGLLAESLVGVQSLPEETLQPPLPTLTGIRGDYLKGVTAEHLAVLELDRILTDPRILVHEHVED